MIAGRCECGQVMERVNRKPDEHMRCFGIRWCGVCGDAAKYGGDCPFCRRRIRKAWRQVHGLTPAMRRSQRARDARWWRTQRLRDTPYYRRQKERKRERYAALRVAA